MTIDDQIRDEKLMLININTEAAKVSALSSGKIIKHEYLTSEEILPSSQKQIDRYPVYLRWKRLLKNKQKQLKIKGEKKLML